jgi:aminoglycoside phosphotransferase (APT) family kinase protein
MPVPRPHGLVVCGEVAYLFMRLMPGQTMDKIWSSLHSRQKSFLTKEQEEMFDDLRSIPFPEGMALGVVAGEGCKDTRRHTRISHEPIYHSYEFWNFQHSDARAGSELFLNFLRHVTSIVRAEKCVFTHGDLRTEKIG